MMGSLCFLLGVMCLVCGLCGLPPPNGATPQALLHSHNCGEMVKDKSSPDGKPVRVTKEQRWTNLIQSLLIMVCIFITIFVLKIILIKITSISFEIYISAYLP